MTAPKASKLGESIAAIAGTNTPAKPAARKTTPAPASSVNEAEAAPQFTPPQRQVKVSSTYRLPVSALDAIDEAVFYAAQRGDRLTKEDAVAQAILAYWTPKKIKTG
jgi:hypothetical protein